MLGKPQLRIPPRALSDLNVIRDLNPEDLQQARAELSPDERILTGSQCRAILNKLLGEDAAERLLRQLITLQPTVHMPPYSDAKAVTDAVTTALDALSGSSRWDDDQMGQWRKIEAEFRQLLEVPSIRYLAKSIDLQFDREHLLSDVRIITDIRPVFDDRTKPDGIRAAAVIHTLRIRFSSQGGTEEFHIAIDPEDIERLRSGCDRALAKEHVLRTSAEQFKLTFLESAEDF